MVIRGILHLSFTLLLLCIGISKSISLSVQRRMINGDDVKDEKEFETTVYLNFLHPKAVWKVCGGVLVSNQWVLTSAHTLEKIVGQPNYVTVGIGKTSRVETPGDHNYTVSKIVLNPDYADPKKRKSPADFSIDNDLALLKLSRPVADEMDYLSLPNEDDDISGEDNPECYAAGWGAMQEFKSSKAVFKNKFQVSDELQKIKMKLISKEECIRRDKIAESVGNFYGKEKNLARSICADMSGSIKQSPCYGDNGSPFICKKDGKFKVYGILLGGDLLCRFGKKSTFLTEVPKFVGWIKNTMKTM